MLLLRQGRWWHRTLLKLLPAVGFAIRGVAAAGAGGEVLRARAGIAGARAHTHAVELSAPAESNGSHTGAEARPPPHHDGRAAMVGTMSSANSTMPLWVPDEPHHDLLVCNAFAFPAALDVVRAGPGQLLTAVAPLEYKVCQEFHVNLQDGDQLDFKTTAGYGIGSFFVRGLPRRRAKLLLVPRRPRQEEHAEAATFDSHIFTDSEEPQLALIDAFQGKAKGQVRLLDWAAEVNGEPLDQGQLNFSTVITVETGHYELVLSNASKSYFAAPPHGKIVVIRVGSEDTATPGLALDNNTSLGDGIAKLRAAVAGALGTNMSSSPAQAPGAGLQLFPEELIVFSTSGSAPRGAALALLLFVSLRSFFDRSAADTSRCL